MTIEEIQKELEILTVRIAVLRANRNALIRERYQEMYNIKTWNKVKVGYVYEVIAKDFQVSVPLVKKIIQSR